MKYISPTEKYFTLMSPEEQLNLATKAAWLSYVGGYTQGQVAKKMNISSAKAHRLIAYAHHHNVVKIFIEGEVVACVELEEKLIKLFGLNSCTVVPTVDADMDEFDAIGTAGAGYLYRLLKTTKYAVIGVGKGRSLSAVVEHLPHINANHLKFVSVSGGLTQKYSTNPFDVIHKISERTHSESYFLPVPYIAKDLKEKEMLLSQPSVIQMLDFARTAEIYIVGLGSIEGDAHVHQSGLIEEKMWQIMKDNHAVGDFMGAFFDQNGRKIDRVENQLALGLSSEDIKGKKVIAIVGGPHKGRATLAALKTRTITDLIISESSAIRILK